MSRTGAAHSERSSETPYVVYGAFESRQTVTLLSVLKAKKLACAWVEETASLSLVLASRAGGEPGPFLRTPEGFVLAGFHAILDWIERVHPAPMLLPAPETPVRRVSARLLESWIELWLPLWPRRSWRTLEKLGRHLDAAGFLLGPEPTRPDFLLAGWLESEVLVEEHARAHLGRHAPRLVSLGSDLLAASPGDMRDDVRREDVRDDVIPISALPVLEEIATEYHDYLLANHAALKDGLDRVSLDLGLGKRAFSVRRECEARRVEIGSELAALSPSARRDVNCVLEPVGAWHAYSVPSALEQIDPADPRSL